MFLKTTVFPRIKPRPSGEFQKINREDQKITFKLESEKSISVRSHHMTAAIIRGKTVE
jgi:hypothetical protein